MGPTSPFPLFVEVRALVIWSVYEGYMKQGLYDCFVVSVCKVPFQYW